MIATRSLRDGRRPHKIVVREARIDDMGLALHADLAVRQTPKQAAAKTGRPYNTVREWSNRFSPRSPTANAMAADPDVFSCAITLLDRLLGDRAADMAAFERAEVASGRFCADLAADIADNGRLDSPVVLRRVDGLMDALRRVRAIVEARCDARGQKWLFARARARARAE